MKRPRLNIIPAPLLVSIFEGAFELPGEALLRYTGGDEVRGMAEGLAAYVRETFGFHWSIGELSNCPAQCSITVAESSGCVPEGEERREGMRTNDLGKQGYVLEVNDGIRLLANTPEGMRNALLSFNQLLMEASGATIQRCRVEDAPTVDLRMVMLDLARLKEKHEYYYHTIDFLSRYKVNAVFLHLTDSEGCAIELKGRPELVSPYAFSQDEIRDLVKFAAQRGVELIPEIESFGHAGFILFLDKYRHLAEGDSGGSAKCLCTMKEESWRILSDIYKEVAPLFSSSLVHSGCDEADFGHCPDCQAEIERAGKDGLLLKHLSKVYDLARSHGKTPVIWGDILLQHRRVADRLPKDIIICHWDYRAQLSDEPVSFLQEKGFQVIGCPALVQGSRTVLPHADTLENIESFARIVREQDCLGYANTVWIPQRYITDTLWYGLALGAELAWSGESHERSAFDRAFVSQFFGPEAADDLAIAVPALHEINRGAARFYQSFWNSRAEFEALLQHELIVQSRLQKAGVRTCLKLLRRSEPTVTRHKEEFDALVLAAEVLLHMNNRALAPSFVDHTIKDSQVLTKNGRESDAAELLTAARMHLEDLRAEEEALAERISNAWDRWRYSDDPKKNLEQGENIYYYFTMKADCMNAVIRKLTAMAVDLESQGDINWDCLIWCD